MVWIYFLAVTENTDPELPHMKADILFDSKPDHRFPNLQVLRHSLRYLLKNRFWYNNISFYALERAKNYDK